MICKFCGTDTGEKTSCPVCNNGKSISSNDEEKLEQAQAPVNEAEAQNEEKAKGTELAEELNKKTKPLKFIGLIFGTMPVTTGLLIPMILFLSDALPREPYPTIAVLQIMMLGYFFGDVVKGFYGLIENLLLRSMIKSYNIPLSELANKLVINGKIENKYHTGCLVLHPDNKNSKYAFVKSAAYIVVAVICSILSYFYISDITLRYEMAGGLPSTGKVWFFITPLAVLIATIVIAREVVELVLQAKGTSIETTKSN